MSVNEITPEQNEQKSFSGDFLQLARLWPYLRPNRRYVMAAILLIPLVSLLQMSLPLVIRSVIDEGISKKNFSYITGGSFIFLAVVIGEYSTRALQSICAATAIHRMIRGLRSALVQHVLSLSARFHDRTLSGRLVTRATSDFDNLSESLNLGVLTSVIDLAVLIGSFAGLFILDWRLALAALVLLPLVGTVVYKFSTAMKRAMLAARAKLSILNGFTQECLQSSASIKLLSAERELQEKHRQMTLAYRDTQMRSVVLDASMFAVIDGMSSITIGILLWIALTKLDASAGITAGVMVAFVQYIQQVFEPLKNLGNKVAMLQGAFAAIDRVFGLLDTKDFIGGDLQPGELSGQIKFERVSFAYEQPGKPSKRVLREVSFELPSSQSLAIVGPTGSGKSTIIKLATKLYDGYEGRIEVDGKNLAELDPVKVREQIAIVPQDIVIFEGSIAFNISLGLLSISEEDIHNAATVVGADKFINTLPGGMQFQLSEGGLNLSHGQRQLITFARALARKPALIILDEATSSVDPDSERLIQRGIAKLLVHQSIIVIAHRLSTIKNCDKILVLQQGKVIEQGAHQTLLEQKGLYAELVQESATHNDSTLLD